MTDVLYRVVSTRVYNVTWFEDAPDKKEPDPYTVLQQMRDTGEDIRTSEGITIAEIPILYRTPKGCWVERIDGPQCGSKVFINWDHQKKYAYRSRHDAVKSFLIRRRAWLKYIDRSRERCKREMEQGLELADRITPNGHQ